MKKIILSAIAVVAAAVGTVIVLDTKDATPGAGKDDACMTQLAALAKNGKINCEMVNVHVSKWTPSHPVDDNSVAATWMCNGGPAPDQNCLTSLAGGHDLGTAVVFDCANTAAGIECKAQVSTK